MEHGIKILHAFLRFPIRPTCPACLNLPDVTTLVRMTKCREYVTKFLLTSPYILVPIEFHPQNKRPEFGTQNNFGGGGEVDYKTKAIYGWPSVLNTSPSSYSQVRIF